MILTDVNVLVHAFRRESAGHARYASWLSAVVDGREELALHEATLGGFLRIVTNPRIYARPAPVTVALDFAEQLVGARRGHWLAAPGRTWATLAAVARADTGVVGNRVPDALLAALCLTHGCRLATADRGFGRFPGLDHFDPVPPAGR